MQGEYFQLEPEELEAIAIESKRIIEIDEFVPGKETRRTRVLTPAWERTVFPRTIITARACVGVRSTPDGTAAWRRHIAATAGLLRESAGCERPVVAG